MRKPAFISPIQKVKAGALHFGAISVDGTKEIDGLYPVDCFKPGMATMSESDWRQFELTATDAVAMVQQGNADIASERPDKKLRMNYAHDRSGPKAGEMKRVELTAEGGVRALVAWTGPAQASIRAGEWDGTSPEFFARVVLDGNGVPKEVNGRVLMQPFALSGGALENDPAMLDLELAANIESEAPEQGKEAIVDMKKLALKLGLPETTTPEDVEKALDEKLKPALAPVVTAPPAADAGIIAAVAERVLAAIDPKKLATEIREGAKADAMAAIRAENHDAACTASVDAAIMGGRVKKSEREQALKLAKADLEAFKTMTATMRVVAPVAPVYVPGGSAVEGDQEAGSFADANLSDPETRARLDIAATARVKAKKDPDYSAATLTLTGKS